MAPSSASNPIISSLQKSQVFWILSGLTGTLMLMSVVMHSMLNDVRRDDDLMLLGSEGLTNGVRQSFDLRAERHNHNKHHKHHHHDGSGEEDKGWLGKFMHKGGNQMSMGQDAIDAFADEKAYEKKQRAKKGILTLREQFERDHSHSYDKLLDTVDELRVPDPKSPDSLPYDLFNCPMEPPHRYPFTWNVMEVLENWNPDETQIPTTIHQSLCIFDWNSPKDQEKALNYREAQVPFIVHHFPETMKTSVRWTTPGYLEELIGDEPIRNEHNSNNNHFMYWKTRRPDPNFVPPTDMVDLSYAEWLEKAQQFQEKFSAQQSKSSGVTPEEIQQERWYFRLNAMLEKHSYVYEELPIFDPTLGESLVMIHPEEHRGINCRFGMKGVIAETHFDSSSNFIALMGGQRRYILAHPDQCRNMELYPQSHYSGRHSSINWSTATQDFLNKDDGNKKHKYIHRPFTKAQVNEVVLQAGDLLYLPTYWFHFIVSLNVNYQCNSRSGASGEYEDDIAECGFTPPTRGMRHARPKRHE